MKVCWGQWEEGSGRGQAGAMCCKKRRKVMSARAGFWHLLGVYHVPCVKNILLRNLFNLINPMKQTLFLSLFCRLTEGQRKRLSKCLPYVTKLESSIIFTILQMSFCNYSKLTQLVSIRARNHILFCFIRNKIMCPVNWPFFWAWRHYHKFCAALLTMLLLLLLLNHIL